MADFVTTDYVIGIVASLLSSLSVPRYLKSAPDFAALRQQSPDEYVVINSLPINANVMQKCHVNVNYHVKDKIEGVADSATIESGSQAVMALLKTVTTTAYLVDFESQETIREPERGEHYSNLRFSFKYINY